MKKKEARPAYGLIAHYGGVYTLQYYNQKPQYNIRREGYDIGVFRDADDDLPIIDLRDCVDQNLIFNFIMNNPKPDCVCAFGLPESLDHYLKRFAEHCLIDLKTLKQLKEQENETKTEN